MPMRESVSAVLVGRFTADCSLIAQARRLSRAGGKQLRSL